MAILSDWTEHAAAVIEELDPVVVGEADGWRFQRVDGLMLVEQEPLVSDRAFDVGAVESGATRALMGPRVAQREGRAEVVIRYDPAGSLRDVRARMDSDTTMVVDALEATPRTFKPFGGSSVQRVTYTGSSTTTTAGGGIVASLAFSVLYTEEIA